MKTILVTGASSGYGLATARYFHDQGWKVIATMRRAQPDLLPVSDRSIVLPLDVTDEESIAACLAAAGQIDVLVNNAGIGMAGAFEVSPMSQVRMLFETNTFGVMAMTQALLPKLRQQGGGVIVNVTSSATLAPPPFAAAYTASKMAIEGFSAALAGEVQSFGIAVKLVEPGYGPATRFAANTVAAFEDLVPEAYRELARPMFNAIAEPGPTTTAADVAEAIWHAVNDTNGRLRFPAGPDALALWENNK